MDKQSSSQMLVPSIAGCDDCRYPTSWLDVFKILQTGIATTVFTFLDNGFYIFLICYKSSVQLSDHNQQVHLSDFFVRTVVKTFVRFVIRIFVRIEFVQGRRLKLPGQTNQTNYVIKNINGLNSSICEVLQFHWTSSSRIPWTMSSFIVCLAQT